MRTFVALLTLMVLSAGCATTSTVNSKSTDLALDASAVSTTGTAAHFTGWLTGHFDNHLQFIDDQASEVQNPHGRVHSVFVPVTNPAVGEHLLSLIHI